MLKAISSLLIKLMRFRGVIIDKDAFLYKDVLLSRGVKGGKVGDIVIKERAYLSKGVILRSYGGSIEVGENTFLGEYVVIYGHGGVKIGKNSLIAMKTSIVSSNHLVPSRGELIRDQRDVELTTTLGDDVWIGANVSILGGISIGTGAVIGAGSVVTKNIPPYAVAVGNPAKVIKFRQC